MSDPILKTLFHPFVSGLLNTPETGARALVINPPADFRLPEDIEISSDLVQDMRPAFRALQAAGFQVSTGPEGSDYDLSIVLCGRHRGLDELWVAEALERTQPGGLILLAGAKTDGIAGMRRRVSEFVPVEGSAAKGHGTAFWMHRPRDIAPVLATLRQGNGERLIDGRFRTRPGMFSSEHADRGSALLADHFTADIRGSVADFGAGWGYLSVRLAEKGVAQQIDLYDASHRACETAKLNMAALAAAVPARVFWRDLLSEKAEQLYDAIVMNPPFHRGRAAEPALGEAMVRAASAALKPGGRLLMVANSQLAYERVLSQVFLQHREIAREGAFKVLWAKR